MYNIIVVIKTIKIHFFAIVKSRTTHNFTISCYFYYDILYNYIDYYKL